MSLKFSCSGADGEKLYIDFAVIRGQAAGSDIDSSSVVTSPRSLLVHACGAMGVDGFVGSGAQVALLRQLAADRDGQLSSMDADDCVVFIHAGACSCCSYKYTAPHAPCPRAQ